MLASFSMARPRQMSDVLKTEVHVELSRKSGVALAATALVLGMVLGKLTVGGQLVPFNPAGNDGSEDIEGVALMDVEAGAADVPDVLYARRMAVLSASGLVWPAGISPADKAAALAALDALALVVRSY